MAATTAGLIAYAAARGQTVIDDAATAQALVRAQDYITYGYVQRFSAGYDETSPNVEPATYEAALLELGKPGFFTATYTPGTAKVLTEVKGIRWQVIGGSGGGAKSMTPVSTTIEAMLSPYIGSDFGAWVV